MLGLPGASKQRRYHKYAPEILHTERQQYQQRQQQTMAEQQPPHIHPSSMADLVIAVAYFLIPLEITLYLVKRRSVEFG